MIMLRRGTERRHVQRRKHSLWLTFDSEGPRDPPFDHFTGLAVLNESQLPPGGGTARRRTERAETLTYVYRGALAQVDSRGRRTAIHCGEFQLMTTAAGGRQRETNLSRTEWAHFFQITLRPLGAGLHDVGTLRRFSTAQRRNVQCLVVSPDGRGGSLQTQENVFIYSSVLDPGHHTIHELAPGRSVWLHVMVGEARLGDTVELVQGDGVGVTAEPALSVTAGAPSEILLVDLGPLASGPSADGNLSSTAQPAAPGSNQSEGYATSD